MASGSNPAPLIVLVGETGSGKTALALELSKQFDGEIIAADSRTVYQGMDIGTAKPTAKERSVVPHHLLDIVAPQETFTVSDFKWLANEAIDDVASHNHVPFLVGGTGLYIDAVLYDFTFRPVNAEERTRLQSMDVEALQAELRQKGISLPNNARNPRHLIRTLETNGILPSRGSLRDNTLILGLRIDRERLRQRLQTRIEAMISAGLVQETKRLAKTYGWDMPALQTTEYRAVRRYLVDGLSLAETKELCVHNDLQLAKRQRTWFKRNKSIHWINGQEEAVALITTFLNK